jgi:phage terminase, small subunit
VSRGKYKDWLTGDGLIKLQGWARDGLSDEQIAHNMGISRSTLSEWKNKYSDIADTLKKTKEIVDREVENALFKRAMGYKYDEVTYERGEEVKRVTKEVAPDTTAQIFWLKNRKPAEWRDKIEQQQTVTIQDDGFLEALKGTIQDDWDETS